MTSSDRTRASAGFSLIEVLVSLVVSGILMAMISMVMGQVVQNDESLRAVVGKTGDSATFRRILHRDLDGMQGGIKMTPQGFTFITTHNRLMSGPLPVTVSWTFQEQTIRRTESSPELQYGSESVLARGLQDWQLDLFELTGASWHSGKSMTTIPAAFLITGIRLTLQLSGNSKIVIVERIPYVTTF